MAFAPALELKSLWPSIVKSARMKLVEATPLNVDNFISRVKLPSCDHVYRDRDLELENLNDADTFFDFLRIAVFDELLDLLLLFMEKGADVNRVFREYRISFDIKLYNDMFRMKELLKKVGEFNRGRPSFLIHQLNYYPDSQYCRPPDRLLPYFDEVIFLLIEYGQVLDEKTIKRMKNDADFKAKVETAQGKVAGNQLRIKRNLNYKRRKDYLMFLVQSKLIGKDAPSSVFSIFYKEIAAFL
jgi:hypothetical protein